MKLSLSSFVNSNLKMIQELGEYKHNFQLYLLFTSVQNTNSLVNKNVTANLHRIKGI